MRGDYTKSSAASTNPNGHYESCLNATCSRSPSPVRRHLWEPKHPPPGKFIKDSNNSSSSHSKNSSCLKLLGSTKPRSSTRSKVSRDDSPFIRRPGRATSDGTPRRGNRDPLFTYTINEGPADDTNPTKRVRVTIQQHPPRHSPPSSRSKTPEPYSPNPAGNLTLQLELNASKSPPVVNISSNNNNNPNSPPQTSVPSVTTCAPCPCPRLSSSPTAIGSSISICKGCSFLCLGPRPPSQPPEGAAAAVSCDSSLCQPCPCPYLNSSTPRSKEDKATSPIKPCCTPEEETAICDTPCNSCLCSSTPEAPSREDRATSPIRTRSRSGSPTASVNFNPSPAHSRSNSFGSSQGSIEIKSDAGQLNVDWDGNVGPVEVDLPIPCSSFEDQIHRPELEVFYTSSCNRSREPSPPKSRSCFSSRPSSPPLSERLTSRESRPAWNNCTRLGDCCPSEKHSSTCSPWRSRSGTPPSRSPRSKPASVKELSRKNSSEGSLHIYSTEGQLTTQVDWIHHPVGSSDVESHSTSGAPRRFDWTLDGRQSRSTTRSGSPTSPLSPRGPPAGQLILQWNHPPPDDYHTECEELDHLSSYRREARDHKQDGFQRSDYRDAGFQPLRSNYKRAEFQNSYYNDEEEDDDEEGGVPEEGYDDRFDRKPTSVRIKFAQPSESRYNNNNNNNNTSPPARLQSELRLPRDTACCSTSTWNDCAPPLMTLCPPSCDAAARPQSQPVESSCRECCCCSASCAMATKTTTTGALEGINPCTALPPHLQSDWSANLRNSSEQLKTKPILYRDAAGHEHIMFADGSIEHLSHHCHPVPPPPRDVPPPSPPRQILHEEEEEEGKSGQQLQCSNFCPRSGDIVIRASPRLSCLSPGKDDGQVAFFTSDYLDLQEGDSVVRLGKFDSSSGRWSCSRAVEMYLRGSHGRWMSLGTHEGHECLRPLEPDKRLAVKTPNKLFQPKLGDLVIETVPGLDSFYFWNPEQNKDSGRSQLLLRAYIGRPRVVDQNHNLACCVSGHLPVGYAELYAKVKSLWLFLGRDDHMFSEYELLHFS